MKPSEILDSTQISEELLETLVIERVKNRLNDYALLIEKLKNNPEGFKNNALIEEMGNLKKLKSYVEAINDLEKLKATFQNQTEKRLRSINSQIKTMAFSGKYTMEGLAKNLPLLTEKLSHEYKLGEISEGRYPDIFGHNCDVRNYHGNFIDNIALCEGPYYFSHNCENIINFKEALMHHKIKLIFALGPASEKRVQKHLSYYSINNKGQEVSEDIIQYQYKNIEVLNYPNWVDFTAKSLSPESIQYTFDRLSEHKNDNVLMHCSAGVGRTGTLVLAWELYKRWGHIFAGNKIELISKRVIDLLFELRRIRPFLVQTPAQLSLAITLACEFKKRHDLKIEKEVSDCLSQKAKIDDNEKSKIQESLKALNSNDKLKFLNTATSPSLRKSANNITNSHLLFRKSLSIELNGNKENAKPKSNISLSRSANGIVVK